MEVGQAGPQGRGYGLDPESGRGRPRRPVRRATPAELAPGDRTAPAGRGRERDCRRPPTDRRVGPATGRPPEPGRGDPGGWPGAEDGHRGLRSWRSLSLAG